MPLCGHEADFPILFRSLHSMLPPEDPRIQGGHEYISKSLNGDEDLWGVGRDLCKAHQTLTNPFKPQEGQLPWLQQAVSPDRGDQSSYH